MRLVADANVLLSAVLGGQAKVVIEDPRITEVITTSVTLAEVQEYAARLAVQKRLPLDVVLMATVTLPVRVVERTTYEASIPEARRRIAHRDPDDVDVLALALHTALPVWSNDNDFESAGVEWFTTAEVLAYLR